MNNNRYSTPSDSMISKFIIPKDEDISYKMAVSKKRYQALFYQKAMKYDSLAAERDRLFAKEERNDKEYEKINDLILEIMKVSMDALNKVVWFTIKEEFGEYRILMFYENEYNKANGSGL